MNGMFEYQFDPVIVAFAILILVITVLQSFDLFQLTKIHQKKMRNLIFVVAAALLGTSVWLVHFLLITTFPMQDDRLYYRIPIVFIAWLFPVVISLMLFMTIQSQLSHWIKIITGSAAVLMLTSTMHVAGYMGIMIEGGLHIDKLVLFRMILIPICLAGLSMYWLLYKGQGRWGKAIFALLFSFVALTLELTMINVVHIDATRLTPAISETMIASTNLGQLVVICAFLFLFLLLFILPTAKSLAQKHDAAYRQNDDFFANLIEVLPLPICIINTKSEANYFSRTCRQLLNVPLNYKHPCHLKQFLQADDYDRLRRISRIKDQEFIYGATVKTMHGKEIKADIKGTCITSQLTHEALLLVELNVLNENNSNVNKLTKRENDVYLLLREGLSNKEIALSLNISENTVKNHVSNIFSKMNISDRNQVIDQFSDGDV